jgi:hypothetical protein
MEVTNVMGPGDLAPQLDLQASVMRLDNAFEYLFTQMRKSKQETECLCLRFLQNLTFHVFGEKDFSANN